MTCPICKRRKAKRLCPARAETICTVCCGTEREVTIDCPRDCAYLIESRKIELARMQVDWSKLPFPESKFDRQFALTNGHLLNSIDHAVCKFAAENPATVDTDAVAVLQSLAESYRTQASGIIYEKPIDYALQRALYETIKAVITEFRKKETERTGMTTVRDSDVRDSLIFLTQLAAVHENGRPKGRAYLDLIRRQFPKEEFQKPASNIVLL